MINSKNEIESINDNNQSFTKVYFKTRHIDDVCSEISRYLDNIYEYGVKSIDITQLNTDIDILDSYLKTTGLSEEFLNYDLKASLLRVCMKHFSLIEKIKEISNGGNENLLTEEFKDLNKIMLQVIPKAYKIALG